MSNANEGQRKLVARDMSLSEIAKVIDVSRQTVSKWKSAKSKPGSTDRSKLERVFGISVASWDLPIQPGEVLLPPRESGTGRRSVEPRAQGGRPSASPGGGPFPPMPIQPRPLPVAVAAAPAFPPYPEPPGEDAGSLAELQHVLDCIRHDLQHRKYTPAGISKIRTDQTRTIGLISKLEASQELKEDRFVRDHPAWHRLRRSLLIALEPYPEASKAALEALQREYVL